MIGEGGGSAFVFTYLLCLALVGFPILVAEWLIGRRGQTNPIAAMKKAAEENLQPKIWFLVGASGVIAAFLILSFYSVIGGWALNYILQSGTGTFNGISGETAGDLFANLLANPAEMLIWHTVFMIMTVAIVALGVASGLERAAKLLMPLLGICLFVLVGYGFTNGGMSQTIDYLFSPDWSKINQKVVLDAMGQAFFTLSLGMGVMLSYGSYLGKEVNLLRTAGVVIVMDTVIAIAAGLAIFPIVFANGLETNQGPSLIFITLPIAFGQISGGVILGALFFLLLTFAAITSAMSLMEPVVEFLEEKTILNRAMSTLTSGVAIWALGVAALLSQNRWADIKLFDLDIFDFLEKFTSNIMLPLTGLATIIFLGWFMRQQSIKQELNLNGFWWALWQLVVKVIAPLSVVLVFAGQIGILDQVWQWLAGPVQ
ncbi:sodium-dependent transporter [Suttonella sp. R2A3]|nr:sodium-dependent transporter [Suttonella sp. R2A3]